MIGDKDDRDMHSDKKAGMIPEEVQNRKQRGSIMGANSEAETSNKTQAAETFSYEGLYQLLEGRKKDKPEGSYTTYLFEKGLDKILKKVGEECTEVIIAAKDQDKKETIYEIADLAYHVMVLMVEAGISLDDISTELASRHVIDHKVKQEKMASDNA